MNPTFRRWSAATALAAAVALVCAGTADAAATPTYAYTYAYTESSTFNSDAADSLCGAAETVTLDGSFTIHLVTALPNLTADEVLALWNNEGAINGQPAPITHIGYHETGSFTDATTDHTYTGWFTQNFTGVATANSTRFLSTGSFLARGTSETGTPLRATSVGPTMSNQTGPVFDHTHNSVTGCLPNA